MQEFEMGSTEAGHNMSNNQRTQGQRMPTRARSGLLFASNFFRHPRMPGSIVPSSRFLIRQLLEPVDWSQARVSVEYGPGVGVITSEVLRRMRPDALLIAIETNPAYVAFCAPPYRMSGSVWSRLPPRLWMKFCDGTGKATRATSFRAFRSAPFPLPCARRSC